MANNTVTPSSLIRSGRARSNRSGQPIKGVSGSKEGERDSLLSCCRGKKFYSLLDLCRAQKQPCSMKSLASKQWKLYPQLAACGAPSPPLQKAPTCCNKPASGQLFRKGVMYATHLDLFKKILAPRWFSMIAKITRLLKTCAFYFGGKQAGRIPSALLIGQPVLASSDETSFDFGIGQRVGGHGRGCGLGLRTGGVFYRFCSVRRQAYFWEGLCCARFLFS